ncbi:MAG TPA: hypothetical protein VHA37_01820 [Candidatus Saccharimonadales bacterium]|nr:hypothetical protein [Candidatus Saccharimonadales bacterium]
MIKKLLLAVMLTASFSHVAAAQTVAPPAPEPTPAPAPIMVAPPGSVWTLVKHVRFPIVQDQAIAAYPDFNTCQNEVYIYSAQFKQWFTTYTCELRAQSSLGFGPFLPHPILPPHHIHPMPHHHFRSVHHG